MARLDKITLLALAIISALLSASNADIGSAAHYEPPYLPTACYGTDPSRFPAAFMFGAAGEGIWDNGAACGREYLVKCLSSVGPRRCIPGEIIRIKIVDRAASTVSRPSKDGTTLVLPKYQPRRLVPLQMWMLPLLMSNSNRFDVIWGAFSHLNKTQLTKCLCHCDCELVIWNQRMFSISDVKKSF